MLLLRRRRQPFLPAPRLWGCGFGHHPQDLGISVKGEIKTPKGPRGLPACRLWLSRSQALLHPRSLVCPSPNTALAGRVGAQLPPGTSSDPTLLLSQAGVLDSVGGPQCGDRPQVQPRSLPSSPPSPFSGEGAGPRSTRPSWGFQGRAAAPAPARGSRPTPAGMGVCEARVRPAAGEGEP